MLKRVGRALLLHCPNCGSKGIVSRWTRLAETCPRCHHRFERDEGYWLGAIAINTVVSIGVFAAVLVAMLVVTWPDPPWAAVSVVTIAVAAVTPLVLYPWSKTLWVALEISVHPPNDQSSIVNRRSMDDQR